MIYRGMEKKDIIQVAQLEKENFSTPWSENSLEKEVNNAQSEFIVAEKDGTIAGYAGMYLVSGEGDITNIVVKEQFRGQGIGDGLVKSLIERAESNDLGSITLEVRVSNAAAIHLYEKNGFISEGIRPGFYEKPREDAMIMWLRDILKCE